MSRNQLKKIREFRGLTQAALAEKSKVSLPYIRILEQGGGLPGVGVAERLAGALGVDPDQLFFRQDFGADRIATLGELYADDLVDLSPEDREKVFLYVLCADETAWKVIARGRTPWPVLWENALAFDEYKKKFPAKR